MFANADLILTREQFWRKLPDITCLYADSSIHVVTDQIEVDISSVLDICDPPTDILKIDVNSQKLLAMSPNVSIYDYPGPVRVLLHTCSIHLTS